MSPRSGLSCAVAASILALAAAASGAIEKVDSTPAAARSPPAGKPIVIGAAVGRTGLLSVWDNAVTRAAELAVKDINARDGVLGRPLKIIYSDTRSDLALVQRAALDVIDRGADFVLTTCDYDYGAPAARAAQSKGVLAIGCAGGPLYGRQGIGPLAFNTAQGNPTEGATVAGYAYNVRKWRRAYMLCDISVAYSKTLCAYFKEVWEKLGGKLAGEDTFENGDPAVASQVARIRSTGKFDFLFLSSYAPGGPSALRQIRAAGIDEPIFGATAFDGTHWLDAVPNLGRFIYSGPASRWGNPIRNPVVTRYTKRYGQPPSYIYPLLGYAAVETLALGAKRAHTTRGDAVARELEKFRNEALVSGPTTYTSSCHIPLGRQMAIIAVRNKRDVFLRTYKPSILPESPC